MYRYRNVSMPGFGVGLLVAGVSCAAGLVWAPLLGLVVWIGVDVAGIVLIERDHKRKAQAVSDSVSITLLADHPGAAAQLSEWHFAEWRHLYPSMGLADWRADLDRSARRDGLPITWIARRGEKLLGSVSLIVADLETHRHLSPWLASLFVAPEARGLGLGGQLVRSVLAEARTRGLEHVYLFTPAQEAFHARFGFLPLEKATAHGTSITIMRWSR